MKSTTRFVKIAPKKLNLVADMMRGRDVNEAAAMLKFIPKKAAALVKKSLNSAVANAENNLKQSKENLYICAIYATEGPKLKRSIPVSRGRAHPIIKRMSHLKIELKVREKEKAAPRGAAAAPAAKTRDIAATAKKEAPTAKSAVKSATKSAAKSAASNS